MHEKKKVQNVVFTSSDYAFLQKLLNSGGGFPFGFPFLRFPLLLDLAACEGRGAANQDFMCARPYAGPHPVSPSPCRAVNVTEL